MFGISTGIIPPRFAWRRAVIEPIIFEDMPIPLRKKGLADGVQTVQLMEHVQLDDVLVIAAGDPFRGVGQLACRRVGDLGYADYEKRWAGKISGESLGFGRKGGNGKERKGTRRDVHWYKSSHNASVSLVGIPASGNPSGRPM